MSCPSCQSRVVYVVWQTSEQAQMECHVCKWAWLEDISDLGVKEASQLLDAARMQP